MGLILERATLAEIKLKLEAAVWLRLGAEGRGQSWRQCLYMFVCVCVSVRSESLAKVNARTAVGSSFDCGNCCCSNFHSLTSLLCVCVCV